ncbi:unnamed protein product [Rotaria sordida]|uniref:Uncharacterized protein n=1 Tax=Rotaria sordida TaxID=392033 RepID=A0A814P1I9_9BILA|nr:unnamed protein product [Rotaria sordida]
MHLFPSGKLLLSKSMIVQALRGAENTQMRQCIIARFPQNNKILLTIYGANINNYLDNFVENFDISEEKKSSTILQTRKEVAVLLSFYYIGDPIILCKIVNQLLHEITNCGLTCWKFNCNDFQSSSNNQELLLALTEKYRKIKVKRHTQSVDDCLRLLVAMHKKIEYSRLTILERSYRDQFSLLINFLSTLNLTATVIVDSLDESKFFFNQTDPSLSTLQKFVESITNDEILNLALGNWG